MLLGQDDALLQRYRVVVQDSGPVHGRVHGSGVGVLGVALAGELIEQQALALLDLPQPLVDAALRVADSGSV